MEFVVSTLLLFVLARKGNSLCETDSSFEPCLFKNNREFPYPIYTRHPSIDYSSSTDDTKYCDLFALNQGEWYWSSYNMTNYCVDHRKCGTNDPIYLNGSIPSPEERVVNRTACVRTFGNCCEHTLNLRIKNCEYFMVYCFLDLHPSCHSRFCFDVDLSVETTTTTTTTTKTTTSSTLSTEATTSTTRTPARPQSNDHDNVMILPCDGMSRGDDNKGTVIILAVFLHVTAIALVGMTVMFCRTNLKRKEGTKYVAEEPPPYEK